jgi:hypothetical protein
MPNGGGFSPICKRLGSAIARCCASFVSGHAKSGGGGGRSKMFVPVFSGLNGYSILRFALGVLLLVTAGLKRYQLATEPVLGSGLLDSRWFLIFVVEFELFFGLWLLGSFFSSGQKNDIRSFQTRFCRCSAEDIGFYWFSLT